MRTTVDLDDRVLAEAKLLARQTGTTLTAVIEDALRERLARRQALTQGGTAFRLHTFTGHGLQAGVDLDDSAALRELMDGRDGREGR